MDEEDVMQEVAVQERRRTKGQGSCCVGFEGVVAERANHEALIVCNRREDGGFLVENVFQSGVSIHFSASCLVAIVLLRVVIIGIAVSI